MSEKLVKCKSCEKEISIKSKKCPHCGESNPVPIHKGILGCFGFIIIALVFLFVIALTAEDEAENISEKMKRKAFAYKVVDAEDYSISNMKRLRWVIISPLAKTFQGRAFTAIQAAKDLQKETDADETHIRMEMDGEVYGKGYLFAMAAYTPGHKDKKKIWEVSASKNQVDDVQVKIYREWYENRDKFLDENQALNEQGLKNYIADALSIKSEDVSLPWVTLENFFYNGQEYDVLGSKLSSSIANPPSFSKSLCETDLSCWAQKHLIAVSVKARPLLERYAKYDYEWTDGIFSTAFSHYVWHDSSKGIITYIGDKLKLQNGFGAWQNYIYECDYDPNTESIIDIRLSAGRI
jgi:hypothetical protein